MKKYIRISALALCGAMILTLAACGGKKSEPTPAPEVSNTPEAVESVKPTETPEVSQPIETAPVESESPAKPVETQKPAEPSKEPEASQEPAGTPEGTLTAADVYAQVSAVAGGNPMIDAGFVLEEFYNLSADDLEDFAFYMPELSATTEEIFIAKVKSGKLDAIKTACESRQQGMKEDGTMYPSAAVYVENSQIVTNGDWIMFVVAADSDAAVNAFNACTK